MNGRTADFLGHVAQDEILVPDAGVKELRLVAGENDRTVALERLRGVGGDTSR